jgi:hypothetical protein
MLAIAAVKLPPPPQRAAVGGCGRGLGRRRPLAPSAPLFVFFWLCSQTS